MPFAQVLLARKTQQVMSTSTLNQRSLAKQAEQKLHCKAQSIPHAYSVITMLPRFLTEDRDACGSACQCHCPTQLHSCAERECFLLAYMRWSRLVSYQSLPEHEREKNNL